jgi:hypothetical protein
MDPVQVDNAAVKDFFVYFADVTFTAVNQRVPATINVQADADFILVKIMSTSTDSPLDAQGGALMQITDQGSQRNLFDNQVPLASVTGSGQRPFILPWVHRFPRQGSIGLDLTNTGTNTNRIRLTFAGFKVIPVGRL